MQTLNKLLALFLALCMITAVLCGCSVKKAADDTETTTDTVDSTETDSPVDAAENQAAFEALCSELILYYFNDDPYAYDNFFVDPSNVGYVRPDDYVADLGVYEQTDWEKYFSEIQAYQDELDQIDYDSLTDKQKSTYKYIAYTLKFELDTEKLQTAYLDKYTTGYIDSFGGLVANFASIVENYKYHTEQNVIDVIDYTKSTEKAFKSCLDYAQYKADNDCALTDYTISEMMSYLDQVLEAGDSYYLYNYFRESISSLDFLTEEKVEDYCAQFNDAMTNSFMVGVKELREGLEQYMGLTDNVGYLGNYGRSGKSYYKYLLCQTLGYDYSTFDIGTYYDRLYAWYQKAYDMYSEILDKADALETSDPEAYARFNAYLDGTLNPLDTEDPEEMLAMLKELANYVVTPLENAPTITIKYVDESVAEYESAVAYYIVSEFDDLNCIESITINPYNVYDEDGNMDTYYVFTTMMHEGYPGHMYSHILSKENNNSVINTLYDCLATGEGWAQFVKYALAMKMADMTDDLALKYYYQYEEVNDLLDYVFASIMDYKFSYDGWNVDELNELYGDALTEEEAVEYISYYAEMPTDMHAYGFGECAWIDMYEAALEAYGDDFSMQDFTYYMLCDGEFPLSIMEERCQDYIALAK